jgi:hypothetical protein
MNVTNGVNYVPSWQIEYESYLPISYDGMTIQTEMVRNRRKTMPSATPPEEEDPTTMLLGGETPGNEDNEKNEEIKEGIGSTRVLLSHRRRRPAPTTAPRDEGGRTSTIVDLLGMNYEGSNSYVQYITCCRLK